MLFAFSQYKPTKGKQGKGGGFGHTITSTVFDPKRHIGAGVRGRPVQPTVRADGAQTIKRQSTAGESPVRVAALAAIVVKSDPVIANAEHDRVDVVDVSSGAIAHRLAVADGPHQFAFTDTYAYVRHLGTAEVVLIPLSQLSLRTTPGIQRVAFGSRAPGEYANPATADAISPTGEWTAVVTANPADLMVYYYMEGMIAPMGSYSTYGRIPRAVGVVDRSVRETERGVYAARFRVPAYGDYEVAFLIDSPFVDHCFAFRAVENPRLAAESEKHPVQLAFLNEERRVSAGRPLELRFTLTGSRTGEPLVGLEDVVVLATRPPGTWQERLRARPLQNGLYEATVPADQPGAYYVSVAVPSLGLDFTELPYISFLAVPSEPSEQGKGGS